jgi:hypothetical protein
VVADQPQVVIGVCVGAGESAVIERRWSSVNWARWDGASRSRASMAGAGRAEQLPQKNCAIAAVTLSWA